MAQEIEIEFKVLLSKEEFRLLETTLPFPNHSTLQTNYYFETRSFDLKDRKSALRIREKNETYTLTLKQPHLEGILETHDPLNKLEFLNWMDNKPMIKPSVSRQLEELKIDVGDLYYYGALKTERKTFKQDSVLYVLDKSYYNGKTDYELEIEADSKESGNQVFNKILADFHIEAKEPITKIERFFASL